MYLYRISDVGKNQITQGKGKKFRARETVREGCEYVREKVEKRNSALQQRNDGKKC